MNVFFIKIDSSLGDGTTALENGDESCLHIWHFGVKFRPYLGIASPNLSGELLTD